MNLFLTIDLLKLRFLIVCLSLIIHATSALLLKGFTRKILLFLLFSLTMVVLSTLTFLRLIFLMSSSLVVLILLCLLSTLLLILFLLLALPISSVLLILSFTFCLAYLMTLPLVLMASPFAPINLPLTPLHLPSRVSSIFLFNLVLFLPTGNVLTLSLFLKLTLTSLPLTTVLSLFFLFAVKF